MTDIRNPRHVAVLSEWVTLLLSEASQAQSNMLLILANRLNFDYKYVCINNHHLNQSSTIPNALREHQIPEEKGWLAVKRNEEVAVARGSSEHRPLGMAPSLYTSSFDFACIFCMACERQRLRAMKRQVESTSTPRPLSRVFEQRQVG